MATTMNKIKTGIATLATASLFALASCGGGSDSNGCQNIDPARDPNLPGCGRATPTPTPPQGNIVLGLKNPSGATTDAITPEAPGTLEAVVKDRNGNGVAGIAVTFITTDKTAVFVPASATALSNASGVASITLRAGDVSGAFTISASTVNAAASNTVGYTVVFPTLTLSALSINPATLSAGGNASVNVTVLNGAAPYTASLPVTFTSNCLTQGKATLSSPVVTQNGVAVSSYTDKGCGVPDTITASVTLAGATTTKTGSINVLPASVGSISFVDAKPTNIALKGTGGAGRLENSVVTFKVVDSNGNPIVRKVSFQLDTSVGGLIVDPLTATSAADGTVSTVVKAGTINTPVRVIATVDGTSPAITSLSDELVVSSGVGDQSHFSLSTEIFNIEGWNHDGVCTAVTAHLSDHFGNPVPDGTAVSFTAEGGQIGSSCLTGRANIACGSAPSVNPRGACTVGFKSSNPRPGDGTPLNISNGRVTIMAYALGEESFTDNPAIKNGINLFDAGETFQDLREPFRYDRAITDAQANAVNNGQDTVTVPGPNEEYIDSDGNGVWSPADGFYNGVLQSVPNGKTKTIHVRQSLIQIFSGSDALISGVPRTINLAPCSETVKFVPPTSSFELKVFDLNGNIMPAGTTIQISTKNGTLGTDTSYIVPNTNATTPTSLTILISSDASQSANAAGSATPYTCSNTIASGVLTIKITTPLGVITRFDLTVND